MFNTFQNTYLRIFHSSFPVKKRTISTKLKPWLTTSIKISCANKRKLYHTYRYSNDFTFKLYYKKYCKILSSTIVAAKKKHYDELAQKSNNRTKMTWNIVKTITNNSGKSNKLITLNTNNYPNNDPITITNAFNTYFSSVAENLIKNSTESEHMVRKDPLTYLNSHMNQSTSTLRPPHN